MPWPSRWLSVLCMAATSALGGFQRMTRWVTSYCAGCCKSYLWNGCRSALDCKCCLEPDVRAVGRQPLPLKSCMRGGVCLSRNRKGTCCVNYRGLTLNSAKLYYVLAAFAATLLWMSWTRADERTQMWLLLGRPLQGAFKLHNRPGMPAIPQMVMVQALWLCFLPGVLMLCMLSQFIRVLGCIVSQATRNNHPLQPAIPCPSLVEQAKYRVVRTIWQSVRQHLPRQAQAWTLGLLGILRPWQAFTTWQDPCADMVERGPGGNDSSSAEYVDVGLNPAHADDEAQGGPSTAHVGHDEPDGPTRPGGLAATTAGNTATPVPPVRRIIYDRLGQVVREPTGPPPIVLNDAAEYAEEYAEAGGESSAYNDDEEMEPQDDPADPAAPLPHEMGIGYRHVSLAMSQAICEVLRRNGNRRDEFHVLSIPPAAWKTTEGFVLQALPLSDSTRRHPNILRCADGPTFEPPRATDAEMEALRTELAGETIPRPGTATTRTSTASHARERRQPWPSMSAPPVPTPASTMETEPQTGLRTPRDAMVAVAMEADASEASMPAETVVMTGTSGGEASSVGGGTAPMTPTRTSTAISGNSMGTPLRINRKQGAYFSHGLRKTIMSMMLISLARPHSWCLNSGVANLTGPRQVEPSVLRPRHSGLLSLPWCCRPQPDHWTDCLFATPPTRVGKRSLISCSTCSCPLTCSIHAISWLARYNPRRTLSTMPVPLFSSWTICAWCCATVFVVCLNVCHIRSQMLEHKGHTGAGASTTSPLGELAGNLDPVSLSDTGGHSTSTPWQPARELSAGPPTRMRTNRSRLGPKSQGCCRSTAPHLHPGRRAFLWCFMMMCFFEGIQTVEAAADARVGFIDHRLNPGAKTLDTSDTGRAKHGEHRHSAQPTFQHPHREIVRKRALRRAINRADRNPLGQTWYRGKLMHRTQLGSGSRGQGHLPPRQEVQQSRYTRRLRLVSWNAGGLMDTRYQEVLAWLAAEAQAGHPVDILTLQETCWKQDMEYRTACGPADEAYHVVHSAGGDKSGIMIMIRQGLLPAHDIQYVPLVPGRAVHLRLRFPTPMDVLCLYQVSWNVTKSTLEGHKVTALLKQRARIWRQVEQWLRATPGRHGCLLVGDLNTPLTPEPGVCGPVPLVQNIAQQDQTELQAILRTHACCALNSWTGTGAQARTFIPPKGDPALQGTRIDFVIARGSLIDNEAKQAGVISAPFVPACGARHKPVQAKIRFPTPPKSGNHPASGRQPAQVCKQLRDPRLEAGLATHLSTLLAQSAPEDDLDEILLQGWAMTRPGPPGHHKRHEPAPQQNLTVRHRIQHMWQLRASLRRTQPHVDTEGDLPSLASIWKAWIQVARLQACTRQLRKDCRQHKTLKIFEAVQADNIYTAAKKFAPRQARRRLQLRTKDGQLMSHEQEFQCIKDYFKGLYHGPNPPQVILSQAVQFEPAEVRAAILKLSAGKAMPQHSAPAALWRKSVDQVAFRLCSQLNNCLQLGCRSLPPRWSTSDMALIPKPGKAMTSPEQLRPISLLPMPAKALGSMLAERLHEHAYRYLQGIPQYAYMKGRHLGMALDRVASHCISIRRLLHDQANTLHARRSGRRVAQVCGGCMLSLDLSKAYDHVPWEDLAIALRDAEVPTPLVELVLLLHQQARIRVAHHAQWELLKMHRGLRQGCSLAPALWIFYSGWLLKGLHATGEVDIPASNTSYADDFHFCWQGPQTWNDLTAPCELCCKVWRRSRCR